MAWTRRGFLAAAGAGLVGAGDLLAGRSAGQRDGGGGGKRRVVLFAGPASHSYGAHEHPGGCRLLADRLNRWGVVEAEVVEGRWPQDNRPMLEADAVVVYSDGGGGHPLKGRMALLEQLAARGVGLGFMHYALIPPDKADYASMLRWIGGYYEPWWSVNPFWTAQVKSLPAHPVTRGVGPFEVEDEWYFHMRFAERMAGVEPVLTAVPPDKVRMGKPGPHSGNPVVASRKGMAEHLSWAFQADDGRRGWGFTGGHWHWNWAHDGLRRLVLNAVAWLAGVEVPVGGVPSERPDLEELVRWIGPPPKNWNREAVERRLAGFAGLK